MAVTPEPGDVVLVARLREASWISRAIQRTTGSWYSHALIHLGQDRYAHALPKRGGSITVMETDAELAGNIVDYVLYDLFRPASAPSPEDLLSAVEHYQARAAEWLVTHINPCGRVAESPGMIFSDGSLLVLSLIRWVDDLPPPVRRLRRMRLLRDALLVTANDKDGRLFCSEFVHRVLDAAGARPKPPPAGKAFIDLGDLPTDEPALEVLGVDDLFDWLHERLWACFDFDQRSLQTCGEVLHTIKCHYQLQTPVPTLEMGNFLTPNDLALSPSLHKIASRYRLINGDDTGWTDPLPLPPFTER